MCNAAKFCVLPFGANERWAYHWTIDLGVCSVMGLRRTSQISLPFWVKTEIETCFITKTKRCILQTLMCLIWVRNLVYVYDKASFLFSFYFSFTKLVLCNTFQRTDDAKSRLPRCISESVPIDRYWLDQSSQSAQFCLRVRLFSYMRHESSEHESLYFFCNTSYYLNILYCCKIQFWKGIN